MIKLIKISMVAALVAFSAGSFAQGKIAVFDVERAILNTDAAQAQIKDFEANADFAAMKAKYESMAAELQALDKELKTDGVTWSDEKKIDHRKKMEYLKADFDLETKKIQQEQQIVFTRIIQGQAQAAQQVVKELVDSEGIGLILNAQAVQYADSAYNITAKITDRLNNLAKAE